MAWNVAKLKFSRSKTLDGPAGLLLGLAFGSSGAKMYCVEMLNCVREYDLGLNYDPFTETYAQKIDLSADSPNLSEVAFNPTGTKMYVNSTSNDEMNEYDLGVAWDISTAVHSVTADIREYSDGSEGFRFKSDGTMLYIVASFNAQIVGYSLSTPWDISTMAKTQSIDISECISSARRGIDFKSDGTKMYVSCTSDKILEYGLDKAWDIETSSYLRLSGCSVFSGNVMFDSDGTMVHVISGDLYEYTLPIGKHRAVRSS